MSINKLRKGDGVPFTQVSNEVLYSNELSLKAKGLWAYMLAKPDDWNFTASSMAKELKENRKTILSIMKELKEFSLLEWHKKTDGTGEYIIYNLPQKKATKPEKQPKSKNGTLPKNSQSPKMPPWQNATVQKTDCINNKDTIQTEDFIKTTPLSPTGTKGGEEDKKSSLELPQEIEAFRQRVLKSGYIGRVGMYDVEYKPENVYIDAKGRLYTDTKNSKQLVMSTLKELWTQIYNEKAIENNQNKQGRSHERDINNTLDNLAGKKRI